MSSTKPSKDTNSLHRVNTRIFVYQDLFIKSEVKKSKVVVSEGEVHRMLLAEAIEARASA